MDLESDHGDPIILLNAFKQWLELKSDGQNTNTRQWCKRRGFEEQRFYEMTKLRRQFKDLLDVNRLCCNYVFRNSIHSPIFFI